MSLSELVGAVQDAVKLLAQHAYAGEPQSTIDEFLEADEELAVRAVEGFEEEPAQLVEPRHLELHENPLPPLLVVDGSSRIVKCIHANLVASSVAVASSTHGILLEYPPRLLPPDLHELIEEFGEPFISLQPKVELSRDGWLELEGRAEALVRLRSLANYPYDYTYNTWQVMDEARLALETRALELVARLVEKGSILVVDGPLHPLPRILFRKSFKGIRHYVEAYLRVAFKRIRVLEEARAAGVLVLGLVKRSGSYKLYRVPEVRGFFHERGRRLAKIPDDQVVDLMTRILVEEGRVRPPISAVLYGPFTLDLAGLEKGVEERLREAGGSAPKARLLSREMYFAWMPAHPYYTASSSVVRVEAPEGLYRELGASGALEVVSRLLSMGVSWRRGIPKLVEYADSAARASARAYFILLARRLEVVSPLLYETREELMGVERGG